MTFDEWLRHGVENKWCSDVLCNSHNPLPMSDQELNDWQQGSDQCLYVIRLYETADQFDAAESRI